jgi:hypothetical protein
MPFSLEDAISEASSGKYKKSVDAWSPHVIVDPSQKTLFGQNPASAASISVALIGGSRE